MSERDLISIILFWLIMAGCPNTAQVEIGFNDENLIGRAPANFIIRVQKIELKNDDTFNEIWSGTNTVSVALQGSDFLSITDQYVPVTPGNYQRIRITIDLLQYQEQEIYTLIDTLYQFIAAALGSIIIEANDELKLVIDIASSKWFDTEEMKIKAGHQAFEGAILKVAY